MHTAFEYLTMCVNIVMIVGGLVAAFYLGKTIIQIVAQTARGIISEMTDAELLKAAETFGVIEPRKIKNDEAIARLADEPTPEPEQTIAMTDDGEMIRMILIDGKWKRFEAE